MYKIAKFAMRRRDASRMSNIFFLKALKEISDIALSASTKLKVRF